MKKLSTPATFTLTKTTVARFAKAHQLAGSGQPLYSTSIGNTATSVF
jgi:hypothetical protein